MQNDRARPLDDQERLCWLRLIRSENVGPIGFRQLLDHFGTASGALQHLQDLARRGGGGRKIRVCPSADATRELEAVEARGARLVALSEPAYPALLREIEDAPPVLTLFGPADPNERPAVAIVGSRNASANGVHMAKRLASALSQAGYLVVSGLARGIDRAAHEGALSGGTVAVCAGGVDVAYPPEHQDLHQAIAGQGLVVSEQPCGIKPQARHFPRRNRLISGLTLGVVVVEAAPRSGSLITARMALEQGREVLAVPGAPLDPRARGCNGLIKQGALLVESAEDVIAALAPMIEKPPGSGDQDRSDPIAPSVKDADPKDFPRQQIERLLSSSPVAVDELIRQSGVPPQYLNLVLVELELAGRLQRHSGNRVSLRAEPGPDPGYKNRD